MIAPHVLASWRRKATPGTPSGAALLAACNEVERQAKVIEMLGAHLQGGAQDVKDVLAAMVDLEAQRDIARDAAVALEQENAQLTAKLDQPCGSCHPCTNYADETWREAGRKPPHVYEWDQARDRLAQVQRLMYAGGKDGAAFHRAVVELFEADKRGEG